MFYITFNVPNPQFNLFGVSKSQLGLAKKQDNGSNHSKSSKILNISESQGQTNHLQKGKTLRGQNNRVNAAETFNKNNLQELEEHIQLEKIIKQAMEKSNNNGQSSTNSGAKQKKFKFIGISKKELRNYRSQEVIGKIKDAKDRIKKKYEDQLMSLSKKDSMNSEIAITTSSIHHPVTVAHIPGGIDVGVFFEKRNAKINEPVENIFKQQEHQKDFKSKFRLQSQNRNNINISSSNGSSSQPSLISNYKFPGAQNLNVPQQQTKFGALKEKNMNYSQNHANIQESGQSNFLQLISNNKHLEKKMKNVTITEPSINDEDAELPKHLQDTDQINPTQRPKLIRPLNLNFKVSSFEENNLSVNPNQNPEKKEIVSQRRGSKLLQLAQQEQRLLLATPNGLAPLPCTDEPRSATLRKYDQYKRMHEIQNIPSTRRNSSIYLKDTVQLIHDVVDNINKTNHAMQMSPGEEGNNKQLEQELSRVFHENKNNMHTGDVTIATNKLKKRFKKETVQKFTSKTFDLEKNEIQAKIKLLQK
ncbi:UNKNOWN [Stylonychia lemnae]|uniref:Uncharacterized protein n=1 Tax=Stylonychia lemnae TaxID=5949 RepID=A0A078B1P9_STYLE|nr:UNKNOWN [Stylonychia lemnae]|eukprot:CDW88424.1 UNKNOWN [Stylonychia lemnae]